MVGFGSSEKNFEVAFLLVFSALTFVLFFSLIGANGLIVGNDSATLMTKALSYLSTGKITISDVGSYPPFYHLLLDTFMAFTGITAAPQLLILAKAITALIDLFLILSIYLVAAKFFSKKTATLAAGLLLVCFPIYEINAYGGYASLLSIVFMMLTFLYLSSPAKGTGYTIIAFIFAFSLVLSHQLTTFLAVFILPPFIIVVLFRSKGHIPKALIAALIAGAIAIGIYYLIPMLPFMNDILFALFQMSLFQSQISAVSAPMFIVNFGFVFLFALAGLIIGFFELRKKKALNFYLLLLTAFLMPLFFSQVYLVGIFLPFQRFLYYLLPPMAIFAGITVSFLIDRSLLGFFNNQKGSRRHFLKILSIAIICSLAAVTVIRFDTLSGRISESVVFYSTSDSDSYQAAMWLRENYADQNVKVVVSEKPGTWFGIYAEKPVIAQTDHAVDWIVNAESVLDLSYELLQPVTMLRVYESAGNITEENYIYANMIWTPVSYFAADSARITFRDSQTNYYSYALSDLKQTTTTNIASYPLSISREYKGEEFTLIQKTSASNNSYPMTVRWQFTALNKELNNVVLSLNYNFEPSFVFNNTYVPRVLNWENPWENYSRSENGWAIASFSEADLSEDNCVSVYAEENQTAFGIKFDDLPTSGNVGVLSSGKVDAFRFEYQIPQVKAGSTIARTYRVLTFSQTSINELTNLAEMNTLFDYTTTEGMEVKYRDFASIIRDNKIGFVVYDRQQFNPNILNSQWLQLVYSNDKFIICKINPKA